MSNAAAKTAEDRRLNEARDGIKPWRRWGPYLSDRQWGTVREDYSADGNAWAYLSHDQARSRAYRWGEDGIAGISDEQQRLCLALTLWNGADPILKERFFGLTGPQGNHGEDVKEYWFHLDNLPSHAYMKALYKYPQRAYPYQQLIDENAKRGRADGEYELLDTGIFDDDRYFDVFIEYAKADCDDVLMRISAVNRGPDAAVLHLLPTLWQRNDWAWSTQMQKPCIALDGTGRLKANQYALGDMWLYFEPAQDLLFTDNESNVERLWGLPRTGFAKDGFDDFVVHGRADAVNRANTGTKAAPLYRREVPAGETWVLKLRLCNDGARRQPLGRNYDAVFERRIDEAERFYRRVTPFEMPDDLRAIQRQAFAGLLWSKQYYRYFLDRWIKGDPTQPTPPAARQQGRNHEWTHFDADEVMSMPDTWEYPWFASWDMGFHCVAMAMIDADFAKQQLLLLTREWYMRPNGQIPAYEWAFGDANPPVQAWAALRICQIEAKMTGHMDRLFLERIFQKLLINFTWWVNRKDEGGNNLFEGGFLGLDNISVFDRNAALPSGGHLEQADGTSWMAMYCLNMLALALELAKEDSTYEDVATKFFEHFVYIGDAMNRIGGKHDGLWDDTAGFYFDALKSPDGSRRSIRAFSIAGLIPLFAITVVDPDKLRGFKDFRSRYDWFARNRPELLGNLANLSHRGVGQRVRLALVDSTKLHQVLEHALDENKLLSAHGVRSVSKSHAAHPFVLDLDGSQFRLDYEPAESTSGLFGGNSNWRGPVWMPLNFLLIEALQKHHYYLGDDFKTADGRTLWQVTCDLSQRLINLFARDRDGRRAVYGRFEKFQNDPHWKDLILFHEYFDGDNGAGLGASHQTGWTALVAKLIQQHAEYTLQGKPPDVGDLRFEGETDAS